VKLLTRRWFRIIFYILFAWLVGYLILLLVFRPSHDRAWELGHEALPYFTYSATSSMVTIQNYRDFTWTGVATAAQRYETRSFDLDQLTGVDVFISHFDQFEGLAHIFLSFGFTDGEQIVVSLETRREQGESFSPVLGLLRQFEIIYVVGSESDIVGVRTGHRDERGYLYPTVASPAQTRQLLRTIATEVNAVAEKPRMYNTLTHNCTNEITRPVEQISDVQFPLTWKTILPGYFDEILYELELVATDAPFAEIKDRHRIENTTVNAGSETYSQDLRQSLHSN
jgi:hypothetical protein